MNAADLCRERGWGPGTVVFGRDFQNQKSASLITILESDEAMGVWLGYLEKGSAWKPMFYWAWEPLTRERVTKEERKLLIDHGGYRIVTSADVAEMGPQFQDGIKRIQTAIGASPFKVVVGGVELVDPVKLAAVAELLAEGKS